MAEWPDELFEKAKAWADLYQHCEIIEEKAKPLYDAVRSEERRREESQVCGATFVLSCTCTRSPGHELPHRDAAVEQPPCDRPHLTEAHERIISEVRMLLQHDHSATGFYCLRGEKAHLREIRHELEQLDETSS